VTTGEPVHRVRQLPGAILTRVAASHIRVGTFQYLAARGDATNLRLLADYAISRHYPQLVEAPRKYVEFLRAVLDRQASLIAQWQLVGFIHGVMNTDNMAISGETIDYGPCAFMNTYRQDTVFSSIDHGGRYAYGNQPAIAQWNLARFAETLLPLIDASQEKAVETATEVLNEFPQRFERYWLAGMRKKLGLRAEQDEDVELIGALLEWMEASHADYTNAFRALSTPGSLAGAAFQDPAFQAWHSRWRDRLQREGRPERLIQADMLAANPAVIPRNHRVEEALAAAEEKGDLSVLHRLLAALASPFEAKDDSAYFQEPPADDRCYRTFCGT
jgi:serine/tyrosine/threonine adenylyltransferase